MRTIKWPTTLLSAYRHLLFDRRLCKAQACRYTSPPSPVDNRGRPVYYEPPTSYLGTEERVPLDRWLQPRIVSALKKAFPAVKYATTTQRELLRAVMLGLDVLLQNPTGTGKSFAITLAMLSKEEKSLRQRRIISLVIVPHRDLAYQYFHWIERIHAAMPGTGSLESVAQVLVRGPSESLHDRLTRLRAGPPHILIGTPQALVDALQQDPDALMLNTLSTVVVDEVDYLVEPVPRTTEKYARMKAERMLRNHPGPTRLLLDTIYKPNRIPISGKKRASLRAEVVLTSEFGVNRPQLIMASATFRAHVRQFLWLRSGWFRKNEWVKISSTTGQDSEVKESEDNKAIHSLGGTSIRHHVLVVSQTGEIQNIGNTVDAPDTVHGNAEGGTITADAKVVQEADDGSSRAVRSLTEDLDMTFDDTGLSEPDSEPLPYNKYTIEAVAEVFALDVPRLSLLIVQPSAPVLQIIYELRKMGVDARGLNVLEEEAGGAYLTRDTPGPATENPTLLVSTLATTRGLDLPGLTHVFILGLPKDRPGDAYVHAAGRIGRFGRSGKVITVLEKRQQVTTRKGHKKWTDGASKLRNAFKHLGVRTTKLSYFP